MTTGNILHDSSSAPRQHKSVQYKWFTLYFAYRHAATTMYILSAAEGFREQEAPCADPGIFVSLI